MASKYEALTDLLADRSDAVVVLSFAELDRLVPGGLPASAKKHPAWWANSRGAQPHASAWLDANRRASADFHAGRVRFEIGDETVSTPRASTVRSTGPTTASLQPSGQTVEAVVRFEWLDGGTVIIDGSGKPTFPSVPAQPGIYRFRLVDDEGDLIGVYVGESDNLARRMGNYRNPGPTQPTNQRLNGRFRELIASGGTAELSLAIAVTVDGEPLDLASKPARLIAENAALIRAAQEGLPVENL